MDYYYGDNFRSKKQIIHDAVMDRLNVLTSIYSKLRDKAQNAYYEAKSVLVEEQDVPRNVVRAARTVVKAQQAFKLAEAALNDARKALDILARDAKLHVTIAKDAPPTYASYRDVPVLGKDNNGLDIRSQEALDAFNVLMRAYDAAKTIELQCAVGIKNVGDFEQLLKNIEKLGE